MQSPSGRVNFFALYPRRVQILWHFGAPFAMRRRLIQRRRMWTASPRCRASGKAGVGGARGRVAEFLRREDVTAAMIMAAKLAGDRLRRRNSDALAKQDFMAAALTRFRLDLDEGEEEQGDVGEVVG